ALADAGGSEAVGALYGELGRRIHRHGQTDVDFADVLVSVGFDPHLAGAEADESLDAVIRDSMKAVLELAGDDVGVPIIEFEVGGARRAIYGPIIGNALQGHEADELFEHVMALTSSETFFELKRSRSGPPQIGTSG
ncbi:MAG: disulfide bond formation protein DsbA, partial [Acidimicrobiia bacterium]|nr:disulfide bond formation protein DsbA [Acidimicrobiia bacterium]